MRTPSGRPCKNGGWLHPLNGEVVFQPQPKPERPRPTIDAGKLASSWFNSTSNTDRDRHASNLGVSVESMLALRCGWSAEHRAWSWPMRNGSGAMVGIRLRTESGQKFSVTGGHEGIFLPFLEPQRICWIVEGPTDTAALLTMGKFAIGRPSCSGGLAHISATVARLGIQKAVIIADNDSDKFRLNGERWNPGLDGAERLASEIGIPCCILVLPVKDAREFIRIGGDSELLDSLVQSVVWSQPKAQSRKEEHANRGSILQT